jgi:uncharacterized protein YceK
MKLFNRIILLSLFTILAFCETGCISIISRVTWNSRKEADRPKPMYVGVDELLYEPQRQGYFCVSAGVIFYLPFELIFDTLCLPYDAISYYNDIVGNVDKFNPPTEEFHRQHPFHVDNQKPVESEKKPEQPIPSIFYPNET